MHGIRSLNAGAPDLRLTGDQTQRGTYTQRRRGIMAMADGGRIGFQWGGPPGGGSTAYGSGTDVGSPASSGDSGGGGGGQPHMEVTAPYRIEQTQTDPVVEAIIQENLEDALLTDLEGINITEVPDYSDVTGVLSE